MASEPIKVYIRFRPLSESEMKEDEEAIWKLNKTSASLVPEKNSELAKEKRVGSSYNPIFHFDQTFSWDSRNQEVFQNVAKDLVVSALDGYNATIFAYGQTGSGKTYTMLGEVKEHYDNPQPIVCKPRKEDLNSIKFTPVRKCSSKPSTPIKMPPRTPEKPRFELRSKGVIVMALEEIFSSAEMCKDRRFFFTCSYMEIYNEHVYDLLKDPEEFSSEVLSVIEAPDKEFIVRNLSEQVVGTIDEVLEKLWKGEENRHYASTSLNHHSSRSHTIFRLNVRSLQMVPKQDPEEEESFENITTESVVNFVDLAGSEKVISSQSNEVERVRHQHFSVLSTKSDIDKVMAEGKNINTSLFYLCQVINKLSEKKLGLIKNDSHIPFRNSNLTKILRSSLGGNARTCIICTATAAKSQFEQTLSTLRFGYSARSITNKVSANVRTETNTKLLLAYEQDIANLKKEVEATYLKGKAFHFETISMKQQLENKLLSMCKKFFSKHKPEVSDAQPSVKLTGLWKSEVGDLFSSTTEKLDWESHESQQEFKKVINLLVQNNQDKQKILKTVSEQQNLKNCLTSANHSLEKELSSYKELLTEEAQQKKLLESELEELNQENTNLQNRIDVFEEGLGLKDMNRRQLDRIENLMMKRVDDIKQEMAYRVYKQVLLKLQNKLEGHISHEDFVELFKQDSPKVLLESFTSPDKENEVNSSPEKLR